MRYWNDNRKSCEHVEPREDWKESIEKWIDWMDAIGRTNDTLRTRWYQIVRFSKAVDKSITDVTEDDLIFYLAGMGTEGRRGVRSCVKVFYQWSMKRGLARRNPADEVPTVPMTLPSGCICPEENIEQGLASPDENARLAVMLGAFCGLRRIEMTRINLKTDLEENAEGMVLHVHGKGNKERMLPVPAKLASALRKRTGVWLFPGDVQGHCGVDYVAKRIKTATGSADDGVPGVPYNVPICSIAHALQRGDSTVDVIRPAGRNRRISSAKASEPITSATPATRSARSAQSPSSP